MLRNASSYENTLPLYPKAQSSMESRCFINSSMPSPSSFIPLYNIQLAISEENRIKSLCIPAFTPDLLFSLSSSRLLVHSISLGALLREQRINGSFHDMACCMGTYKDPAAPFYFIGTAGGDVSMYDWRYPVNSAIVLKNAHIGNVCDVKVGQPLNHHYIFTAGKQDGWLKEFDIRFPSHSNEMNPTAAPIQAVRVQGNYKDTKDYNTTNPDSYSIPYEEEEIDNDEEAATHCGKFSNQTRRSEKLEKNMGILSMDMSSDGSCIAVSNTQGDCILYSLSKFSMKSIKRWVLGDFSCFHTMKFTKNSKYLLCCSTNSSSGNEAAHLWNTIQSNRSVCLKTPGDGAPVYQGHFLVQENEHSYLPELSLPLLPGKDLHENELVMRNNHLSSEKACFKDWGRCSVSSISERGDTAESEKKLMNSKNSRREKLSFYLYTPDSVYLEKLHSAFWEQRIYNSERTDGLLLGEGNVTNNDGVQSLRPKQMLQNLPPQHVAYYISSGIMNPCFGRTDLFDTKFVCTPWRGFVIGAGGNHLYDGLHTWDAQSGVCLCTSSFAKTVPTNIDCIVTQPEQCNDFSVSTSTSDTGIIATVGSTEKRSSVATIWKWLPLKDLVESAIGGDVEMQINPTLD